MSDVRRIEDYVYLVFHAGQCVAVCEDLATADVWIWRTASGPRAAHDTSDYRSLPMFLHVRGSLDGPMPTDEIADRQVIAAMRRFGGSFVKALAEAATAADPINLAKIKAAWPDYWARYAGAQFRTKDDEQ